MSRNIWNFIERAELSVPTPFDAALESTTEVPSLDLNKLPDGVVTGNTLIDYSNSAPESRGPLSLALTFATLATQATVGAGADEDEWFAAYKSNLMQLGLDVSPSTFNRSTFRKQGIEVHKAIIPFLTMALGGAAVGPVILALLANLQKENESEPWIRLFNLESRRYETREIYFGAASSDAVETRLRHVAARLTLDDTKANVLFFKITKASAEFESASTIITANNGLLNVLQEPLLGRLQEKAKTFILSATLAGRRE